MAEAPTALLEDPGYRVLRGYWPRGCDSESRWPGNINFRCEYSKSGRAACRGCGGLIPDKSVRLGIMMVSLEGDVYKSCWWYHTMCFFRHREVLKMNNPATDFGGWMTLSPEDRHAVLALWLTFKSTYAGTVPVTSDKPDWEGDDNDNDASSSSSDDEKKKKVPAKNPKKAAKKTTTKAATSAKKVPAQKKPPKPKAPSPKKPAAKKAKK